MQELRGNNAFMGLGFAEGMVNFYTESAKAYWRMWGPLGEPMVRGLDAWAEAQHGYLRWLREASTAGGRVQASSPSREGVEAIERSIEEAQRIASESAREAERIARETESETREADETSEEGIRSTIRESVRRSEAGAREESQARTTAAEETRAGAEEDISSTIRESVRRSEAGAREESQAGTTAAEEPPADVEELPIEDYDSLNVNQITQRLGELSIEELERLRDYEAENKNRRSLLQRFERRIRVGREDLRGTGEAE